MRREFGEHGDAEGTAIRRVQHAPCLIIDDFHINPDSRWQLIQATRLIDYRWANAKPTVFITNLTREAAIEQFGDANWSRMTSAWAKVLEITGRDWRKGGGAA
jgi:DNA replication protein DnaC